MTDGLSLGEDFAEVLRSQHVPEGGGRQEARGSVRVLHVCDGHRRVLHAVVHNGIHGNRHRVLRQNLGEKRKCFI